MGSVHELPRLFPSQPLQPSVLHAFRRDCILALSPLLPCLWADSCVAKPSDQSELEPFDQSGLGVGPGLCQKVTTRSTSQASRRSSASAALLAQHGTASKVHGIALSESLALEPHIESIGKL